MIDNTYKHVDVFGSVSEFGRHVEDSPAYTDAGVVSLTENAPGWASLSRAEVMRRCALGGFYDEKAEGLRCVDVENMAGRESSQKLVIHNDVAGFAPNVPAYLAGAPLNMLTRKKVENPRKFVRIGFHLISASRATTRQINNRGRAFLSVLEALTVQGYAIELWGLALMRDKRGAPLFADAILLKSSTAQWSGSQCAFTMADPSFFRRACLWRMEKHPLAEVRELTNTNYGSGKGLNPPSEIPLDVWFPYFMGEGCDTEQQAYDTVMSQIKEQCGLIK